MPPEHRSVQLIIRIYAMNLETTGQQKDERKIFFRIRKDKKKRKKHCRPRYYSEDLCVHFLLVTGGLCMRRDQGSPDSVVYGIPGFGLGSGQSGRRGDDLKHCRVWTHV